jgi:AhpD family alkylhydroperoxidase
MLDMCFDAQTSGGLLISIDAGDADKFLEALYDAGVSAATVIGKVTAKGEGKVHVKTTGKRQLPEPRETRPKEKTAEVKAEAVAPAVQTEATPCCAGDDAPGAQVAATGSASGDSEGVQEIQQRFMDFMGRVNRPGGLDAYTKQAMSIALSVHAKCAPCLKSQVQKAREKGFTEEEIDEAAWMGIAFGGAPTMMFYKQHKPR